MSAQDRQARRAAEMLPGALSTLSGARTSITVAGVELAKVGAALATLGDVLDIYLQAAVDALEEDDAEAA